MTEREWLTGTDSLALVDEWGTRFTERKARLLALACCRRHARHFKHPAVREAVEAVTAHYADPLAADGPFDRPLYRELFDRINEYTTPYRRGAVFAVACGVLTAVEPRAIMAEEHHSPRRIAHDCLHDLAYNISDAADARERKAQAILVREVLGNPFRPAVVDVAWRTDTVLALARQMYATEDFSAMPILADALQDAGCDSDAILTHLRGNESHARGCWALDLILDKK